MRNKSFITHSRELKESLIRQGIEFTGETGDDHKEPKTYYFIGNLDRLSERAKAGIEIRRFQPKKNYRFYGGRNPQ